MIVIRNNYLSVNILDPREDQGKLGSRYCTGGYIWQVYDRNKRPLLSGPHFPSATPPVFDGQGMPDMFETPLGGAEGAVGSEVCVLGVGLVEKSSNIEPFHPRNNPRVTRFCEWEIDKGENWAVMTTSQRFGDRSIKWRREVRLDGGRIASVNTLLNTGNEIIDLNWFAHPFFLIKNDLTCGKIIPSASMPDNAGYEIDGDGMIRMKSNYPWEKGLFQVLDVPPTKLRFTVPHPVAGDISLKTDYDVARCAVWGNSRTFSFEPFMRRAVGAGEEVSWEVEVEVIGNMARREIVSQY
jgi:hypothetical protein